MGVPILDCPSAAASTTSTGGGVALAGAGRRRGGLTDQVATHAVTPAYLPYAAALTPYARWVSIPALVKVRLLPVILSAYIVTSFYLVSTRW